MTIVAILLMTLGAGFLLVAAIGLARLADPLQRMHSATKAGTLGTALILLGVWLSGAVDEPGAALPTTLFLLVTLPIGAQLLGRASYMSGATLRGLRGDDPLDGVLERKSAPLVERQDGADD